MALSPSVALSEMPLHGTPSPGRPSRQKSDERVPKSLDKIKSEKDDLQRPHLRYDDEQASRANSKSPAAAGTHVAGKPHTVFIHKLFDMLEDPSLTRLIWWSPAGDSFCLYPGEEFSNVLAQYFKHGNIASFIRQLNMYGFHKVNDNFQTEDKSNSDAPYTKWEFRHSANQFRKGDVESLSLIKRKSSKVMQSHKEIVSLKSLPPTSASDDAPLKSPDDLAHDSYHSSVYQHSWNQFSGPPAKASSVTGSDHSRRPVYAAPMVSHPPYPVYSQPIPVPHSPNSPSYSDTNSPSYFLSQSQPSSQPNSRNPSTKTPVHSAESAINLKLIEMNTAINNLKSNYHDLSARYDALLNMHNRDQEDLLQLTEIVDKLINKSDDKHKSDLTKPEDKLRPDDVDRSKTKTPIDRITTPNADCNMSPTNVKQSSSKCADLASFRSQLLRKVSNPTTSSAHKPPAPQNYHLSDAPSTVKNTNIVPQHYPLNPNYTLYNDSLRQIKPEDIHHHTLAQPTVNRHFSVLMDPLQPVPRVGSVSAVPHAGSQRVRTPLEDRMASPGAPKEKDAVPVNPPVPATTSVPPPTAETATGTTPAYVQQYQPIPPPHVYYSHILQQPNQLRASSLPVLTKPLSQKLGSAPQQRHSLTTLQPSSSSSLYEDSLRGGSPRVATPTSSMVTSQPPTLDPAPLANEDSQLAPIKNQLPSMQELNESIRHGPPFGSYSESEDDKIKKRKLDGQ